MEEKIGIKKLYELLFEYSRNKSYYWKLRQSGKLECSVGGTDHDLHDDEMAMVIKSKEYGFIKWLVGHHKLLHPDFVLHLKLFYGDSMPEENFYLMMLAISPNPIEELCKMLRPN